MKDERSTCDDRVDIGEEKASFSIVSKGDRCFDGEWTGDGDGDDMMMERVSYLDRLT